MFLWLRSTPTAAAGAGAAEVGAWGPSPTPATAGASSSLQGHLLCPRIRRNSPAWRGSLRGK
eukprot:14731261-Alexandrium_andersonii.AAC.1